MNNPFLGLYELMGEATKIEASFFIAKIVSPLPNLKVNLNDLILDKDDFLISHDLVNALEVNDKVVLLRINDKFIIISKVVSI
jgi:hypothetical protein